MATRTIRKTWKVSGVLADVTTAKMSDPTGTYGVKRNDTNAVVVADGTAMTKTATGTYEYSFTVIAGVAYTAYMEFVYLGSTYYIEEDFPAIAVTTEASSVTVRWRVKKANRAWAGAAQATVYIQILEGPGTAGIIWHGDNTDFDSDTTDANGYVEFANVPIPCTLGVRTGPGRQLKIVDIPTTATDPYDAGELISLDA